MDAPATDKQIAYIDALFTRIADAMRSAAAAPDELLSGKGMQAETQAALDLWMRIRGPNELTKAQASTLIEALQNPLVAYHLAGFVERVVAGKVYMSAEQAERVNRRYDTDSFGAGELFDANDQALELLYFALDDATSDSELQARLNVGLLHELRPLVDAPVLIAAMDDFEACARGEFDQRVLRQRHYAALDRFMNRYPAWDTDNEWTVQQHFVRRHAAGAVVWTLFGNPTEAREEIKALRALMAQPDDWNINPSPDNPVSPYGNV